MAYIHELAGWSQFRWDTSVLEANLADVHRAYGRLLGRIDVLGYRTRDEHSIDAYEADVISSAAIEGDHLDRLEVRSSLAGRLGYETAGLPVPSREVDGFVGILLDATRNAGLSLSTGRLHGWYQQLFPAGRSGLDVVTTGDWRPPGSDPMRVVSGAIGRERIHFKAPAASRVPSEMDAFLEWIESPASLPRDPVLRAAVAHLWFITIHPYEDGNGGIGRAIADLVLARGDARPGRAFSLSLQIASDRREYYRSLERQQSGTLDLTPWIIWFVGCMTHAIARASATLDGVLERTAAWDSLAGADLNARQRKVIGQLLGVFEGNLTTAKYAALAQCSPDTALRDIQGLVGAGIVGMNGGRGRSTGYRLTLEVSARD